MAEKTSKEQLFSSVSIPKAVMTMALPAIFSQIIVLIYNMADTFYLGLSENAYMVAGISLILPVFNLTLTISGLTGVGGGTQISRLLGVHRTGEARKVSSFCFWLTIFLTGSFSLLLFIFQQPLLRFLGASDQTILYASQYLLWVLVLGSTPTVLSNVMANLLRSAGYSAQAGFGITMGGVLNIFLDPLFMFVLLEPGNEVLGVAIATLISNTLALCYFIWQFVRLRSQTVLNMHFFYRPDRESVIAIFSIGIPSSVATLLFDVDYAIIGRLMSGYGDFALAASGIVLKIERLPLNVGVGICQGTIPILAYNYSAGNYARSKKAIAFSLSFGLLFSAVSVILYEIFAPFLVEVFIRHAETLAYGIEFLRIRVLATPLMFVSFFTLYIFQAYDRGKVSLFLGVARWGFLNIPMLFILNALFGMMGIVSAQVCGDILNVLLCILVYFHYSKTLYVKKEHEVFAH